MTTMRRVVCPVCARRISVTAAGRIRYHNPPYKAGGCDGSYRHAPPPEETDQ